MLVLYGTCKVHHKRGWNPLAPILLRLMSFLAAGLRIFPLRVRIAAKASQEFPGNEGAECSRWTQKPRLTIFRRQVSAPETRTRSRPHISFIPKQPFQRDYR